MTPATDSEFYSRTLHNLTLLQYDRAELFLAVQSEVARNTQTPFLFAQNAQGSFFLKTIGLLGEDHCLLKSVRAIFSAHFPTVQQNFSDQSTDTNGSEDEKSVLSSDSEEPPSSPEQLAGPPVQYPESFQYHRRREPMKPPDSDWVGFINQILRDKDQFNYMIYSGGLEWKVSSDEFLIKNPTVKRVLFQKAMVNDDVQLVQSVFNVMNRVDVGEGFGLIPPNLDSNSGRWILSQMESTEIRYLLLVHLIPRGRDGNNYAQLAHSLKAITDEEFAALQKNEWSSALLVEQSKFRALTPGRENERNRLP